MTVNLNLRQDLLQKLKELKEPIDRIGPKIEYVEDHLEEQQRTVVLNWISRIPIEDHHYTVASFAMEDSGQWLLEHPDFNSWRKSSAPSLFWLHGMGK